MEVAARNGAGNLRESLIYRLIFDFYVSITRMVYKKMISVNRDNFFL